MPAVAPSWSDPRVLAGVAAAGVAFGLALGGAVSLGAGPAAGDPPGALRHAFLPPLPDLRPRLAPDLRWAFLFPRARLVPASTPRDLECLTDAVYYEARGEPADGQAAVAQVVLNRMRRRGFPKSVCGVVFQRAGAACQFSFACDGSVTRRREAAAWRRARLVAARAIDGYRLADVGGATHFHVAGLATGWSGRLMQVARIGAHVFYAFGRRAPEPTLEKAAFVITPTATAPSTTAPAPVPAPADSKPA